MSDSVFGVSEVDLLHEKLKEKLDAIPGDRPCHPRVVRDEIYEVLRTFSQEIGQNPDIEVTRGEDRNGRGERSPGTYYVGWESGPWEWAIGASWIVMRSTERLCEPYFSFDLQLYDAE